MRRDEKKGKHEASLRYCMTHSTYKGLKFSRSNCPAVEHRLQMHILDYVRLIYILKCSVRKWMAVCSINLFFFSLHRKRNALREDIDHINEVSHIHTKGTLYLMTSLCCNVLCCSKINSADIVHVQQLLTLQLLCLRRVCFYNHQLSATDIDFNF